MGELCPCCSGQLYASCCEAYHKGALPPTPLALMRSRYAAYALGKIDYIIETTHPESPYFEHNREKWKKAVRQFSEEARFIKLEIVAFGDDWVSFIAHLEQKGAPFQIKEKSFFKKEGARWLYLSGECF